MKTVGFRPVLFLLFLLLALVSSSQLQAQNAAAAATLLRPPAGAKVALVEFADLECPDCGRAAPLLDQAEKTYKIPLVIYDFPLPQHQWAFDASVYAHYFRSKSTKTNDLERAFRLYIYSNQAQITKDKLRGFVEKFAQEHKMSLPFVVDPQGKLADGVRADKDKGTALGIQHTPTIYVVSNNRSGPPFVEVVDRKQLFNLIDEMQKEAK